MPNKWGPRNMAVKSLTYSPDAVLSLDDVIGDAQLMADWRSLRADLCASYFLSPEWTTSWWRWTGQPPTEVAIWRSSNGNLEAIVALSKIRERAHRRFPMSVPMLTNSGSGRGSADHHGWLAKPDRMDDVWAWLIQKGEKASLVLRSLAPHVWKSAPPCFRPVESSRCPSVSLVDGRMGSMGSKHFRRRIGYYERRCRRLDVTFRIVPPDQFCDRDIESLLGLHRERRQQLGAVSHFNEKHGQLHRDLITTSNGADIGPAAIIAESAGKPIGILYGFMTGTSFEYFLSGWSTRWARYSLGTVLIVRAMQFAVDSGLGTFDFLRGADMYKYRFGAVDQVDRTLMLATGVSGHFLRVKNYLRSRLGRRHIEFSQRDLRTR